VTGFTSTAVKIRRRTPAERKKVLAPKEEGASLRKGFWSYAP